MLRHKDVPGLSPAGTSEKHRLTRSYSKNYILLTLFILLLTILACSVARPDTRIDSDGIAISPRLPTLTRTPLPTLTLTPTSVSTPVAVAQAAESSEVALAAPPANDAAVSPDTSRTEAANTSTEGTSAPVAGAEAVAGSSELEQAAAPSEASVAEGSAGNELPAASAADTNSDQQLATITGTPVGPSTATTVPPTPTIPPTATPTEAPTATSTPTEIPSPTPLPQGWVFSGLRVSTDQYEGDLLLYGDVLNNTDSPQDLLYITGSFYDAQGQKIADGGTYDYWPVETIPPGGWVPFELTVIGMQNAADFDLRVEAESSSKIPHQDFEFVDLSESSGEDRYCVAGKMRNLGPELQSYIAIVVVLYDDQDNVVNFSDYYHHSPQGVVGDQLLNFEVCLDPLNQAVARHELRPLGL